MKDNRICVLNTADAFARYNRKKPVYIVRGHYRSVAVYLFGKRVFAKGWQ